MDTIKTKPVSTEVFQEGKKRLESQKKSLVKRNPHFRSKMGSDYEVKYHKDGAVIELVKLGRRT